MQLPIFLLASWGANAPELNFMRFFGAHGMFGRLAWLLIAVVYLIGGIVTIKALLHKKRELASKPFHLFFPFTHVVWLYIVLQVGVLGIMNGIGYGPQAFVLGYVCLELTIAGVLMGLITLIVACSEPRFSGPSFWACVGLATVHLTFLLLVGSILQITAY